MSEKYIPDLSYWNGKIDFAKVKKNHDAVILRASCGTSKDGNFDTNIQAALDNGLKVGVYHYLVGTTQAVAVNECKAFYSVIRPYKSQISFCVLDFEDAAMLKLSMSSKIALYHAFSDRLRDVYNIKNRVLYTWEWLGKQLKATDPAYDFRWEWYAQYGKNDGQPNGLVKTGWLHQYTSKYKNDFTQSPSNLDMSIILNGHTLAELCGEDEIPAADPEATKADESASVDKNGDGKIVRVTKAQTWNVRDGNGTEFGSLGFATIGQEFEYVATAVNGWLGILYKEGQIGWLSPNAAEVVNLVKE